MKMVCDVHEIGYLRLRSYHSSKHASADPQVLKLSYCSCHNSFPSILRPKWIRESQIFIIDLTS